MNDQVDMDEDVLVNETVIVNFRINKKTKVSAARFFKDSNMTLSSAIRQFLTIVARDKKMPF